MGTEGIVTLGIGSEPGGLMWFFTLGLESGAVVVVPGTISLTAQARDISLTAQDRDFSLTV